MISRNQVESILKINGVAPSSPDDQIRSVLMSARYNKDEVDTAIMVLRQNKRTNETRVDGLHKVFRTDTTLKPKEISLLLGIDAELQEAVSPHSKVRKVTFFQYLSIWITSVLLAATGLLFYMYISKVGFFHPSVQFSLL